MKLLNKTKLILSFITLLLVAVPMQARAEFEEYGTAVLQSLDKITARTATFEANIGATLSYGQVFMKIMSCRKTTPIDQPESAAFLKIWEIEPGQEPEWIFSGWMFASSPALSAMDHPIYDIWVLDCKNKLKSDSESDGSSEEPAASSADIDG